MSRLFCSYLSLEESPAKSEVTDKVEKLVSCTLVRESEDKIAEISVFAYLECRYVEQLAHTVYLLICHRMLDNHDCVVDISSLDEVVIEKEFDLMEEHEGPAYSDFLRIQYVSVPNGILYSKYP